MLHVLGCITQQHDLRLVVLAGGLCLFACVTAISLLSRARASEDRNGNVWIAAAGFVAGTGIWCTHFVAMLAYRVGFPVSYDPTLTILSAMIAVLLCSAGFSLAWNWRGRGLAGPGLGGAVAGAAIGTMHYVGMAAVRAPAVALWDWPTVAASLAIGIVAMASGLMVVAQRRGWRTDMGGAVICTLAVCSMHFTGMSAVTFRPDPTIIVPARMFDPLLMALTVTGVAVVIMVLGLVGSLVDSHLSDRAHAEAVRLRLHVAELEATKRQLEHTSDSLRHALEAADAAIKAKSAFLAAMSHELRTPLNAVIGFSEMLSLETFGSVGGIRNKEYLNDINGSGRHLLALINDILDIARIEAGHAELHEEVIDLKVLARQTLVMVRPQAEAEGIRLAEDIDADVKSLYVDERRLKQVLINLVGNAVKFTMAGGEVGITARRVADGVAIAVSDTGIGIAEQDIPRVMSQFGQIDSSLARQYQGTGLGLPLAKQLTELHGGTLTIESVLGAGTTVTVTLPAARIRSAGPQSAVA
jgi:signal transduction histidine kinase